MAFMFPIRLSGLGVWVGGGAVQFFGEDGDAEVAGLDALDHEELENLQDLVGDGAGATCVLAQRCADPGMMKYFRENRDGEVSVTNSLLHPFTCSLAGRPDRAGQMPVRPESC